MKRVLFLLLTVMYTLTTLAQNEKYIKTMEAKIAAFDTTRSIEGLIELSNTFERIAEAEKKEWLPYYYAALMQVNAGNNMWGAKMNDKIDPVADKAEVLINKAEALNPDNSEIYVVKKLIASLRMMVDPQARFMQYAPVAEQALKTAQQLDPENPRVYLVMGQDKYFTPEQFGGSKAEAKKLFEQAFQKYDAFKPKSSLHPKWGRGRTEYFWKQIK